MSDDGYQAAEKLKNRLGKSRSQLYTLALTTFITRHKQEGITEALNKIYDSEPSQLERGFSELQFATVRKER